MSSKSESKVLLPNGGYGWIIVLTSFLISMISEGILYTFGLFQVEISNKYPKVGKSGVGWIPSIMVGTAHIIGPIGSILLNKFGVRIVSICGIILASLGFFISYFVNSVYLMYLTFGIISGSGFGLLIISTRVLIPQYFDTKLAFAYGIAVSGSGCGIFLFEWILGLLTKSLNWRKNLLILVGILVSSSPLICFFKPLRNKNSDEKNISKQKTIQILNLKIIKNSFILVFAISNFFIAIGLNIPNVYLPDIEKSLNNSSTLLGISGIFNVLGRIFIGLFSDRQYVKRIYIFITALFLGGIASMASPHLNAIWPLRIYAAFYGICSGTIASLYAVIISDVVGPQKFNDALGFLHLVQGVGFLIGSPVVGYLYDNYNSYTYGFYFSGASIIISAIIAALIPIIQKLTKTNTKSSLEI